MMIKLKNRNNQIINIISNKIKLKKKSYLLIIYDYL